MIAQEYITGNGDVGCIGIILASSRKPFLIFFFTLWTCTVYRSEFVTVCLLYVPVNFYCIISSLDMGGNDIESCTVLEGELLAKSTVFVALQSCPLPLISYKEKNK